jgi:hypothetical protein
MGKPFCSAKNSFVQWIFSRQNFFLFRKITLFQNTRKNFGGKKINWTKKFFRWAKKVGPIIIRRQILLFFSRFAEIRDRLNFPYKIAIKISKFLIYFQTKNNFDIIQLLFKMGHNRCSININWPPYFLRS